MLPCCDYKAHEVCRRQDNNARRAEQSHSLSSLVRALVTLREQKKGLGDPKTAEPVTNS
jgi:hypothetical protein